MKIVVISMLMMFTLLALNHKRPYKTSLEQTEYRCLIRDLEIRKAEETHRFNTRRFEQLRNVHPEHYRDVMEAELKMKLSGLDLEIAKLRR